MITVASTTGISKLINEVKYTGSLMDKTAAKKNADRYENSIDRIL
jgi:capsule polysaccharide modification protein KpsS